MFERDNRRVTGFSLSLDIVWYSLYILSAAYILPPQSSSLFFSWGRAVSNRGRERERKSSIHSFKPFHRSPSALDDWDVGRTPLLFCTYCQCVCIYVPCPFVPLLNKENPKPWDVTPKWLFVPTFRVYSWFSIYLAQRIHFRLFENDEINLIGL